MTMDASALLDILKQEKELFCELIDISNTEQEFIMQNDIEGLFDIAGRKERLALAVRELERYREATINRPDEIDSEPAQGLRSIVEEFDPLSSKKAEQLRVELLSVLAEFNRVNQVNGELIKRNLDYINFMLNIFMPEENPTYNSTLSFQDSRPLLFDGKA